MLDRAAMATKLPRAPVIFVYTGRCMTHNAAHSMPEISRSSIDETLLVVGGAFQVRSDGMSLPEVGMTSRVVLVGAQLCRLCSTIVPDSRKWQ